MNTNTINEIKKALSRRIKQPIIFSVLSGSHLYGFNSNDSDYDIRGSHLLPVPDMLGINEPKLTINNNNSDLHIDGHPLDYEFHDLKKFCHLLCKHNASQIEQLYSPHIINTSITHKALKIIAKGCFTSTMFYHFTNFARNEWQDFIKGTKQAKNFFISIA